MINLFKKEIEKEIEASRTFLELAISAQKLGHFKAAEFFLGEAKEDLGHAFSYAVEVDKYDALETNKDIKDIAHSYHELEKGAVQRLIDIENKSRSENKISSIAFINKMLEAHSNEAYSAKKLAYKINILASQEAINDIEELFEELLEKE
ncbi:MAG: hypothetical protein ACRCVW_06735 [Brevinema sp.]